MTDQSNPAEPLFVVHLYRNKEFKLTVPWEMFMYIGKMYASYVTEITCH